MDWDKVNKSWDDLLLLIRTFHPASRFPGIVRKRFKITAIAAEGGCKAARKMINPDIDPVEAALTAKNKKDVKSLRRILEDTWFGMPEGESVRDEPGFDTLCYLISSSEDL